MRRSCVGIAPLLELIGRDYYAASGVGCTVSHQGQISLQPAWACVRRAEFNSASRISRQPASIQPPDKLLRRPPMKLYYCLAPARCRPTSRCTRPAWRLKPSRAPPRPTSSTTAPTTTPSTRWAMCRCWSWTTAPLREGPAIVQYHRRPGARQNSRAGQRHTSGALPLQSWLTFCGHGNPPQLRPAVQPRLERRGQGLRPATSWQAAQWVDGELAGKQYLIGDQFTVADGYLFTTTNWAKPTGGTCRLCQPAGLP